MAHGSGPSRRKSNLPIDDTGSDDEVPPPDGGWGWVMNYIFLLYTVSTNGKNITQLMLFK